MNEKVVIFVGVLTEYQGIDLLLESIPLVAQQVPHVKFLIVGYPNEQLYQRRARALGVEKWTHFTGRISYEDVPRYLSLADVAVSPKTSTTEANLKLFAYMAMGLPAVVFDTPINREILGDLGVYATVGDAQSLAEALIKILQDQERARELGAQSRRKVAHEHSWSQVGKKLGDIYNSIAALDRTQTASRGKIRGTLENVDHRRSRIHRLPLNK
jgi:glycosyltransferase involved in cell wall biosynthesis